MLYSILKCFSFCGWYTCDFTWICVLGKLHNRTGVNNSFWEGSLCVCICVCLCVCVCRGMWWGVRVVGEVNKGLCKGFFLSWFNPYQHQMCMCVDITPDIQTFDIFSPSFSFASTNQLYFIGFCKLTIHSPRIHWNKCTFWYSSVQKLRISYFILFLFPNTYISNDLYCVIHVFWSVRPCYWQYI